MKFSLQQGTRLLEMRGVKGVTLAAKAVRFPFALTLGLWLLFGM